MNDVDILLTKSQSELVPKMESFLNGSDRIFLLTGKPGVGKTFVLQYLLSEHIEADRSGSAEGFSGINVAGITLAHSAKNVLGEFIPNVFTFAKAYGMKEVINQRTGERSFEYNDFNEGPLVGTMSIPVFVFDEVSMFTQEMFDIVLNKAPIFSKLIFVGDKAQLPPINSKKDVDPDADSPVFTYDIPDACKHELDERVRQVAGNPILDLSDAIREQIFGDQNLKAIVDIIRTPNMVDGLGYDFVKYNDLLKHISEKNVMDTRLICYRNDTIDKWNPYIRDYLLRRPLHKLVSQDVVIMKDNFYKLDGDTVEYVLFNSELLRITEVQTFVLRFNQGGSNYNIDAYRARIDGKKNEYLVSTTPEGEIVYQDALRELSTKAKRAAPSERRFIWEAFWKLKKQFCNYSYGYAASVYKSQGSTYSDVYVDINDILQTGPLTPKRKLQAIYTAITRAKYGVHFLKS